MANNFAQAAIKQVVGAGGQAQLKRNKTLLFATRDFRAASSRFAAGQVDSGAGSRSLAPGGRPRPSSRRRFACDRALQARTRPDHLFGYPAFDSDSRALISESAGLDRAKPPAAAATAATAAAINATCSPEERRKWAARHFYWRTPEPNVIGIRSAEAPTWAEAAE